MAHQFYQPPADGPFLCAHCRWFDRRGVCQSPDAVPKIIAQFPARRLTGKTAKVEAGGCCDDYEMLTHANR